MPLGGCIVVQSPHCDWW